MALIYQIQDAIQLLISENFGEDISKVILEKTKDSKLGDLSTNIAMVSAKKMQKKPTDLAQEIVKIISTYEKIENISITGPGFINFFISPKVLVDELNSINKTKQGYGNLNIGHGKKVNVEYVSTNPTGPMHIGHGRNAVFGDSIANILAKSGYNVTREYYVNDAGSQITALAKSAYLRYKEALGDKINEDDFNEDMYKGDYLKPLGESLYKHFNRIYQVVDNDDVWLDAFKDFSVKEMMDLIAKDLGLLGIKMDEYTSEKKITKEGWVEKAIEYLTEKGAVYNGVLEKPKGHDDKEWEEKEQTLFKSKEYGDDSDRVLKKSDGTYTYFAGDIGYHHHKINREFNKIINILGFDHIGYITRLKAAVKALDDNVECEVKTTQMVNFMDGGDPVRMSKRAGNFVTLRDLVEKIGKDPVRFMMLSRHQDMQIDFDFAKVLETSKDNHLFYIQYAHARIYSVIKQAMETFKKIPKFESLDTINTTGELNLIKMLIEWPKIVMAAANNLEPHRVCNYLYDLASEFHSLWNAGKEDATLRFIDESNEEKTAAKVFLLKNTARILAEGLHVLGITPMEEMK